MLTGFLGDWSYSSSHNLTTLISIFALTAMMNKRCKVSPNYYLRLLYMLFSLTFLARQSYSEERKLPWFVNSLTVQDTVPPAKDTSKPRKDSVLSRVDTFHIPISSDSLTAPVNYSAADSMVLDVASKKIFLYGKSEVKYTDISLTAPFIAFDQQTQNVLARMGRDTAGNVVGMAKLTQAETTTVSDSILFNFKSQKG
ncbi:MAG TPA: hypothetical protein VLC28_05120, partial [Flavitalea sp.]|nr:hypothetical protein [Flavitalea sp.]